MPGELFVIADGWIVQEGSGFVINMVVFYNIPDFIHIGKQRFYNMVN